MGLKGLKTELPAPAEVAFGFAGVANKHTAVVTHSLDTVGHCRDRIDFGNVKVAHCLL